MLRIIVRHELRDVIRDGRFRWSAMIIAGLLITALLSGWSTQRQVAAQRAAAAQVSRDTWLTQPAKDPHTAAHYGAYAFKPTGLLSLIDNGVNDYTGVAAWLEAHKQNDFQFKPAQDRASVARLGHVTAATTLQLLIPIVIILLAYTKFAAEREDGTLRQLLAAGVPARQLALGKIAGVGAALAMLLLPATAVGVVALLWTSGSGDDQRLMVRAVLLAVSYLGYFAATVLIALAVSARAPRASAALAALIAFWIVNAVVAPRASADLSKYWYPAPTAFAVAEAVQQETYDGLGVHQFNLRRAADLRSRLFAEHAVSRVEDLPVYVRGIDYLEREAHSDDVWDRQFSRIAAAFAAQSGVHQAVGALAPMMSMRMVSMALAGVDVAHHQHFAAAAEEYRRKLVKTMNQRLAFGGTSSQRGSYVASADFWATVPPFNYEAPDVEWSLSRAGGPLAALFAWLIGGAAALILSIRKVALL